MEWKWSSYHLKSYVKNIPLRKILFHKKCEETIAVLCLIVNVPLDFPYVNKSLLLRLKKLYITGGRNILLGGAGLKKGWEPLLWRIVLTIELLSHWVVDLNLFYMVMIVLKTSYEPNFGTSAFLHHQIMEIFSTIYFSEIDTTELSRQTLFYLTSNKCKNTLFYTVCITCAYQLDLFTS